jgi:hypothetical protein
MLQIGNGRGAKRVRGTDGTVHNIDAMDVEDGAEEAGAGLPVTKPPRNPPHLYNNNYTVKLTYADTFNVIVDDNTGGGTMWNKFRTTSIFDPDYDVGGHQPLFRDPWATIYDYYSVLACNYTIRVWNAAVDPISFTAVGTNKQLLGCVNMYIMPTTDASDCTNSGVIYPPAEMKNTRTDMLAPAQPVKTYTGTITPGDYIVDAKDADNDNTWTAQGSNPAIDRLLCIGFNRISPASPVGADEANYTNIAMQVILEYDVQFTQVKPALRHAAS